MAAEPVEYDDGVFDDSEERTRDLASVRALFEVLDEALEEARAVELFPVWAGDEVDPPVGRIEVTRDDLIPEKFFFTKRFLYHITRDRGSQLDQ